MKKVLIAFLMIGLMLVTLFPANLSANVSSNNVESTKEINGSENNDFGFILCFAMHFFWPKELKLAWNVIFQCKDLDTGQIIEEKTKLLGIRLFRFLPRGHDYEIKITTSKGQNSRIVEDLGFFRYIRILITIYP